MEISSFVECISNRLMVIRIVVKEINFVIGLPYFMMRINGKILFQLMTDELCVFRRLN